MYYLNSCQSRFSVVYLVLRCFRTSRTPTTKILGRPGVLSCLVPQLSWEKLNRGVSKPGGFPLLSGKVQIVSRTLSGLFLVGALNRPRKRKRTNRENPRTIPEQIGKIPEKSGKAQEGQKKERQVQIGKAPRLAALDFPQESRLKICHRKLHRIPHRKKFATWISLWEHPRLKN